MGRKTRQNKITSPELIAQINPKNIRLMNDFLEYLRSMTSLPHRLLLRPILIWNSSENSFRK